MRVPLRGLTGLLLVAPVLGWAGPAAGPVPPPTVVQRAISASSAAIDPFSPARQNHFPIRSLQLPPPPMEGIPLPKVTSNTDTPILVGKIDGKLILQTSSGIEIRDKPKPGTRAPLLNRHLPRNYR